MGSQLGRARLPNGKSLEGSAAFFAASWLGFWLVGADAAQAAGAALLGAALEAAGTAMDNLCLPVLLATLLPRLKAL